MAKVFDTISDNLREFINEQHMFFVGTAPLSADGHVNISPKGLDCLRILNANKVAYLDLTGSGNETSAHLHENGRITFAFCAFKGAPNIVRLYGQGHVVLPETPEWDELISLFTMYPGARQIIVADIDRVQTSCGYAVPLFDYVAERDTLVRWAEAKGPDGLVAYREEKNSRSIDSMVTPLGLQCETE